MDDGVTDMDFRPRPTGERPLLGLTILVVEDSRFASEAIRLLCLRSGGRIRRADCLASAERHLNVYRPSVAIIDLGLPDGSGLDLIRRMDRLRPNTPIIIATSGAEREEAARQSLAAGADSFLPKPVASLAAFQAEIIKHLPEDLCPQRPWVANVSSIEPDMIAFREDLNHAMDLLALDAPPMSYLRRFLLGVARLADDTTLEGQARGLGEVIETDARIEMRKYLSDKIQGLPVAVL